MVSGDPRTEIRIFAEGLLVAAEARVADRLDHEREELVYADGAGFPGQGGIDAAEQFGVPCAPQRRAFGEDRAAGAHQAVRAFLAQQQRDAQARCSAAIRWSRFRNSACCRGPSCKIVLGSVKNPPPGPKPLICVPAAKVCTPSVFSGIVLPSSRRRRRACSSAPPSPRASCGRAGRPRASRSAATDRGRAAAGSAAIANGAAAKSTAIRPGSVV